ncbi:MAG: tetraacyldisaccharide 4'-kinase, partial [Acidocella sp.]|nr:tetraacyldisaccharide 4'-kinase [Acidocella sp.]
MKTPAFWAKRGILAHALSPLGALTAMLTARRVAKAGFDPGIKII